MTLEVLSEEVEDMQEASLVPFNALRNRALLLVKTEVSIISARQRWCIRPYQVLGVEPTPLIMTASCE